MIINHNCCIKLVSLVIFIYEARSHIHQIPYEALTDFLSYECTLFSLRSELNLYCVMQIRFTSKTVSWFRRSVAGLSPVNVIFVVEKVATLLQILPLIPVSIIPPLSHTQITLTEGQMGECWKLANKPVFFRLSGSTGD